MSGRWQGRESPPHYILLPPLSFVDGAASQPRARIGRWVPHILCSEHNYLVEDSGTLSLGSMKMLLTSREAKGQAPWHPALPMSPSPGEHIPVRSTFYLPGYPVAQQLSYTQSIPLAEYKPSCILSPKSPRKWNPGLQRGPLGC